MQKPCLNETELLTYGTLGTYTELHVPPHVHRQIELFYVARGSITVRADDRQFVLHAGEYTVIAPFVLHAFESQGADNLYYSPILPDAYSEQLAVRTDAPVLQDKDGDVAQILTACISLLQLRDPTLRIGAYRLVADILRARCLNTPPPAADDTVIRYIQSHYTEPLTLETISAACNTNRTYVSRAVHAYAGMHLNAFLNRIRLNTMIEQYNITPSHSIEAMALAVGFDCPRTFYRAFRAQFGINPRAYFSRLPQQKTR